MERYKEITIDWSYPVQYKKILENESMNDIGIYYISAIDGKGETLLYIGKTTYNFYSRLKSHEYWLDSYKRKTIKIRLGRVVTKGKISDEEKKNLIDNAEKTIIFYLSNTKGYKLIENTDCTVSAYFSEVVKINNIGYKGMLPRELFIPEEFLTWEE